MAIGTEPPPHFCVLMIGGIVLDEDRALVAIVLREQLEGQVGRSAEDAVLSVVESHAPQLDGAQNFHRLAFPGDPKLGRSTDAAPRGVQVVSCRKLASSVKISAQFFLWVFF